MIKRFALVAAAVVLAACGGSEEAPATEEMPAEAPAAAEAPAMDSGMSMDSMADRCLAGISWLRRVAWGR